MKKLRVNRLILLSLMLVFLLSASSGCGNTDSKDPSAKSTQKDLVTKETINPCSLLTKAEAELALGEQVKEQELSDSRNVLGQKICIYSAASSMRFIQLSIVQTSGMDKVMKEQGYTSAMLYKDTESMMTSPQPISGIGDQAFWGTPGLHVLKGETYLTISVGNTDLAENLELAKKIAQKVIQKLP